MAPVLAAIAVAAAYLLGAVPFGLIVCLPLGRDPRTVGSGRTGGTNVYRTAGMPAALLTVAGDILKGYVALWLAARLVPADLGPGPHAWAVALAALAVIVGHNYSVFTGFAGGAGSSPNIGAILWLDPLGFAAAFALGAAVLFGVRIASLASLVASSTVLAAVAWRVSTGTLPPATLVYGVGQLALVAWALRPNLARLRAGTERRLQFGRPPSAPPAPDPRAEPRA